MPDSDINDDFAAWLSTIQSQLDRHASLKSKKVKTKNFPEWYTQEILETRKLRDTNKNYEIGQHIRNTEIKQKLLYGVQKGNTFLNPLPILRTRKLYGNIYDL